MSASNAGADALEGYGESAGAAKVDIDDMLESQAQLRPDHKRHQHLGFRPNGDCSRLLHYIQQYANQTDLSTEALGKAAHGSRYRKRAVRDADKRDRPPTASLPTRRWRNPGRYPVAQSYIDQKLQQIQVDAQQQNLSALYQQQAEDITALTQAQQAYNDDLGEHDQFVQNYIAACGPYVQNAEEMAEAAWQASLAEL
ncbi:MAG: hypothetical protein ACLTSX_12390 [Collinsella sp.]